MDLQQNGELEEAAVPQKHARGVTVVEFNMDANVDTIRDTLHQTVNTINQNKADAMVLSQEYDIPDSRLLQPK